MSANIVTPEIQDSVSSLYIAFFGRAPDAAGFGYWTEEMAGGESPFAIAANFARSPEWLSNYGGLTPTQQVITFYQNVFGRTVTADDEGVQYWVDEIEGGLPASSVAYQIIYAAYLGGEGVDPNDNAIVLNKIAVAEYFAMELKSNDTSVARTAFVGVTQDEATVTAAEERLAGEVNPPVTYTLTTNIDTLNVTGVSEDVINGAQTGGTNETYNTGDTVNGNGQTILNLSMSSGAASVADINDVAKVNVNLAANSGLEMGEYTNVPLISITNGIAAQTLTVTSGILGTTYDIAKNSSVGYNITYAGATGAADTANFSASGAGGSATVRAGYTIAGNNVETVNVATTGSNFVDVAAGTNAATINLTGSGRNDVSITSAAGTMTVNASTTTGASNLINVGTLLNSTDTILGSTAEGTVDTLRATLNAAGLMLPTITGVENLQLSFTGAANFSGRNVTGAQSLTIEPSAAVAATVSNLDEGVTTLNIGRAANVTATGAVNIGYAAGSTSDVTLSVGATSSTSNPRVSSTGALTLTGNNGGLTIQSTGDLANTLGAITANAVTSLTIGGAGATQGLTYGAVNASAAGDLTISGEAANLTSAGAVTLDESTSTIDIVSGAGTVNLTGAITQTASGATNATVNNTLTIQSGDRNLTTGAISSVGQGGATGGTGGVAVDVTVSSGGGTVQTGVISALASAVGGSNSTGAISLSANISAADGNVTVGGLFAREIVATTSSSLSAILSASGGDLTVTEFATTGLDNADISATVSSGNTLRITGTTDGAGNAATNAVLDSLTVSGSGTATLFGATSGFASNATINAGSLTGDLTFNAAGSAGNLTVTAGNNTSGVTGVNTITTGAGADTITGGSGNEVITGGAGADSLTGGAGADTFVYTSVGATLTGQFGDTITDFGSTDVFQFANGALINAAGATATVTADLSLQNITGTTGAVASTSDIVQYTGSDLTALTVTAAATALAGVTFASTTAADAANIIFVLSDGTDVGLFYFQGTNANTTVDAAELSLINTLDGFDGTVAITNFVIG